MPVQSTIPDSDSYNWIIAPAGRCMTMVCDGAHTASLLHRALMALSFQGPLLAVAGGALRAAGKDTKAIESLLSGQPQLEAWVQEVMSRDLHDLHTSGVIALWSSIEVAVEDTVTLILLREVSALSLIAGAGVKVHAGASSPLAESDARKIYSKFEDAARKKMGSISHGHCHMLETLGLRIDLDAGVLETLNEVNYVRNCLLHRGGIVDDRVSRNAPNLKCSEGESIRIGQTLYGKYFDAAGKFASALLRAAADSRYVRTK